MVNAFCLLCTRFERRNWRLGYCKERGHYINQPYRNCTTFYIPSGALDRADEIINWYHMTIKYAEVRARLVKEYFMGEVCPSMNFLIDTYTCLWVGGPRKLGVNFDTARKICTACKKTKEI